MRPGAVEDEVDCEAECDWLQCGIGLTIMRSVIDNNKQNILCLSTD